MDLRVQANACGYSFMHAFTEHVPNIQTISEALNILCECSVQVRGDFVQTSREMELL